MVFTIFIYHYFYISRINVRVVITIKLVAKIGFIVALAWQTLKETINTVKAAQRSLA